MSELRSALEQYQTTLQTFKTEVEAWAAQTEANHARARAFIEGPLLDQVTRVSKGYGTALGFRLEVLEKREGPQGQRAVAVITVTVPNDVLANALSVKLEVCGETQTVRVGQDTYSCEAFQGNDRLLENAVASALAKRAEQLQADMSIALLCRRAVTSNA